MVCNGKVHSSRVLKISIHIHRQQISKYLHFSGLLRFHALKATVIN